MAKGGGRPRDVSRQDVARAAGVSVAAVSYVVNGKARENRIAPATAERIRKVAERLGYAPNVYGKVLKTRRSRIIAFITVDVTDPNTGEIIRALGAAARGRGWGMMLVDLGGEADAVAADLRMIETGFAECFILHMPEPMPKLLDGVRALGKPMCVLGQQAPGRDRETAYVEVDNARGGEMAVRHLVELGVRDLGVIADRPEFPFTVERLRGARKALAGARRGLRICYRGKDEDQFQAGTHAVRRWLDEDGLPEGIFAMGDVTAIGALHALHSRGISCPSRVRVVGFDGIPVGRYTWPSLTTVEQPFGPMCQAAMDILEAEVAGGPAAGRQRLLAPTMIVRGSTGGKEAS